MEYTTRTLLVALVFCLSCNLCLGTLHQIAERIPGHRRWPVQGDAHPLEPITFKVMLKNRNLDVLEKTFWELSDPKHPKYGKYLEKHEVEDMIAPEPASVARVIDWLKESEVSDESMLVFSDYIKVRVPVQHAEKIFSTTFSVYKSKRTGELRTKISKAAHIPLALKDDIDFVSGLSELFEDLVQAVKHQNAKPINSTHFKRGEEQAPYVDPTVLVSYYKIPTGSTVTSAKATLGIGGFGDYYSSGALAQFRTAYSLKTNPVAYVGPTCTQQCSQTESDLDVQYSTALANGATTTFYAHDGDQWMLDWAQQLAALTSPPLVNSASYGFSENEQCSIAACTTLGYTTQTYTAKTDTVFQTLGTRGITILVSSGDDGAPAYYNGIGNCPIDNTVYCPSGGCTKTSTQCAEITLTKTSTKEQCYFPMGLNADESGCQDMIDKDSTNFGNAITAMTSGNTACGFLLDGTAPNYFIYSTCTCANLKAVTSSGYTITGYTYNAALPTFEGMYPAASPYVTSVGATQFAWTGNTITAETVATITSGALITSGGGFSRYQKQPSYQAASVASWVSNGVNRPPTTSYVATNRAYPDIAMSGHNYIVYAGNVQTNVNTGPFDPEVVDGTSCSSPALAGLMTLINNQLLNAGKPSLGFLNPLLYQMSAAHPAAFKDIAAGSNSCNRAYCCKYGYTAGTGWDPASGLGTPVYTEMLSYIMTAGPASGADSVGFVDGSAAGVVGVGSLSLLAPLALLLFVLRA